MFYSFLLFAGSLGLLLRNVYGTVSPYRDSGDLIAAAASLGIAHPPGYSLYVLLTHIGIQCLPFGNIAYRANVLSCLWTSLTVVLVFHILRKISSAGPALLAVSVWFLSPSVQRLSIVSEMYSLHALLCAVIFYLLLERKAMAAMFAVGLAFFNHPTVVFMLPGILAMEWAIREEKGFEKIKPFSFYAAALAAGWTLVLYYPLRSFRSPELDWGGASASFRNLWRLVTRADYGGLKLHPEESSFAWTAGGIWDQISLFIKSEWRELSWVGIPLLFIGLFLRRNSVPKDMRRLSGVTFVLSGPLFFILSNLPVHEETTLPILEPYLLMSNLFLLPWLAVGAEKLKTAVWPALALVLLFFAVKTPPHRNDFSAYDYGRNILKTMPLGSSLYEPDDTTAFVMSYLQSAENRRRDIAVLMTLRTKWGSDLIVKKYPYLLKGSSFSNAQEFISALLAQHVRQNIPLFSDHPGKFPSSLPNYNEGLMTRAGTPTPEIFDSAQSIFNFYVERGNSFIEKEPEFFTRHLLSRRSAALNNIGITYQQFKDFPKARDRFMESLARDPKLTQAWVNLGLNSYTQNDFLMAESTYLDAVRRLPQSGQIQYYLGLAQRRAGKRIEARASLEKALALVPGHADAMNELGLTYLDDSMHAEAAARFEKCLDINPKFVPAQYNLGLTLRAAGKNKEAAQAFENYLRLDPNASDKFQVQSWIRQLQR